MAILTPRSRKTVIYADFNKDMSISEINLDLLRIVDEQAVKEAIKNLILVDRGERLFQPEIGSDIRKMLFENLTSETIAIAKDYITTTIQNYEPRASVISVDIIGSLDENDVQIFITFNIINREEPVVLTVTLDRVR